jgi:hypothetical protein
LDLNWDEVSSDLGWQGAGDPLSWRCRGESVRRQVLVPTAAPAAAVDQATLDQYFSQMVAADLTPEDE